MGVRDESLGAFLDAVAASTPTPGGGSVAALVGALSAALARMVAGLARGKEGYESAQEDLASLEAEAARVQRRLEDLVAEDARAYEAVLAARRRPRSTDDEKRSRVEAMQAAYVRATDVPLETLERCVDVLRLAQRAVATGSRGATTDAGVAILLAEAAIRGASLNVRVNLAAIRDEAYRESASARLEKLLADGERIGHEGMAIVEGRL